MQRFLAIALLALLAACASTPPPSVKPEADTSPPVKLDVLTVVVLDRSNTLLADTPYATNNFEPTIANALRQWATQKFVAVGSTGEAIIVIRDASLKAEPIPHPDSWFTREQTSKYAGHAEIEIDVSRRNDHGQVTADAVQVESLPEDPTPVERQNAYYKVLNAVVTEIGANLRGGIHDHLMGFVAAQPPQAQ
jgi:hypothetical protein